MANRIGSSALNRSEVQSYLRTLCLIAPKQQQRQWSLRGAPLLLPTRVKILNGALTAVYKRWDPDLQLEEEPQAA